MGQDLHGDLENDRRTQFRYQSEARLAFLATLGQIIRPFHLGVELLAHEGKEMSDQTFD